MIPGGFGHDMEGRGDPRMVSTGRAASEHRRPGHAGRCHRWPWPDSQAPKYATPAFRAQVTADKGDGGA
jgi:hypothetical protein